MHFYSFLLVLGFFLITYIYIYILSLFSSLVARFIIEKEHKDHCILYSKLQVVIVFVPGLSPAS